MNALFIGYGRMGSAIGEAWISANLVSSITAIDPYPPTSTQVSVFASMEDVPETPFDIIVVAVKPAYACEVLAALPDTLCRGSVVISVAAGVTKLNLEQALRGRAPVVRAMPNTPVLVSKGCTGLHADESLNEEKIALVTRLFSAVGMACWVEREELLNAVTALSGSGPAYYHLFSEALASAGIALGLKPDIANALAAQTALGAASLQTQPGAEFGALRAAVTSPNGTTAAAISVFEQDRALRALVDAATEAAHRRSQELSLES